jgi:hypothetical protein
MVLGYSGYYVDAIIFLCAHLRSACVVHAIYDGEQPTCNPHLFPYTVVQIVCKNIPASSLFHLVPGIAGCVVSQLPFISAAAIQSGNPLPNTQSVT